MLVFVRPDELIAEGPYSMELVRERVYCVVSDSFTMTRRLHEIAEEYSQNGYTENVDWLLL